MLLVGVREPRASMMLSQAGWETRDMAFDWKALAERARPAQVELVVRMRLRAIGWSPTATIVLATSIALLVGLWGGAVLGRVSLGAPAFDFAQLGIGRRGRSSARRQMRRARACRKSMAWRSCACARR